ncbi:MAG: hypothetical protein HY721_16465 [Planctomycetes bacterium]|nr:hypothetical protein [Planctomycetota bacterium]
MRLVRNTGNDRVVDLIQPAVRAGRQLDVVTRFLSLFAFAEVIPQAAAVRRCRFVIPPESADLLLLGSSADRPVRNRLQARWFARELGKWLQDKVDVRRPASAVPQGAFVVRDGADQALAAVVGSLAFSTEGLGLTPGNQMALIQASETPEEARLLSQWFDAQWSALSADPSAKASLLEAVDRIASHRDP